MLGNTSSVQIFSRAEQPLYLGGHQGECGMKYIEATLKVRFAVSDELQPDQLYVAGSLSAGVKASGDTDAKELHRELAFSMADVDVVAIDPFGQFLKGYLEAALWQTDDRNEVPLEENYTRADFSPATIQEIAADCRKFFDASRADFGHEHFFHDLPVNGILLYESAGHDFLLSRNRINHGDMGFDDGDWDNGERLAAAARQFRPERLVVGTDGLIRRI